MIHTVLTWVRSLGASAAAAPVATSEAATSAEKSPRPGLPLGLWSVLLVGAAFMLSQAFAAGNGGAALQATFTMVNDMVGGFGKQLLTVLAFAFALIGYLASNATSVVLKFVGFAIFASVGLGAAIAIVGALV